MSLAPDPDTREPWEGVIRRPSMDSLTFVLPETTGWQHGATDVRASARRFCPRAGAPPDHAFHKPARSSLLFAPLLRWLLTPYYLLALLGRLRGSCMRLNTIAAW